MKNLKQNKIIDNSTTNNIIPYNEYIEGFKSWKKQTTASLSGKHLGYHQSILKPDEIQYSEEELDFGDRIMKLHHTITSIALLNSSPLHLCLTFITLLLP